MDFSKKIGRKIVIARHERKVSQSELARRINITQQCLSGYERGCNQIPLKVFVSICTVLDAPVAWFLPEIKQFGDIVPEDDINFLQEIKQYTTTQAVAEFIRAIATKQSNGKNKRGNVTQQIIKVKPV